MTRKISVLLMISMMSLLVWSGHVLGALPSIPAEGPGESLVLFADDFSDDQIGNSPAKWSISDPYNLVNVEIVSAPKLSSGKALKVVGGPSRVDNQHARLLSPIFGPETDAVNTIVIEQDIQFNARGSDVGVLNMYITKASGHRVHWNVGPEGDLRVITSDGGSTKTVGVGRLRDGWNRIRLVANRKSDELYVFLNDMANPVFDSPMRFRQTIDTWAGAQVIFLHHFFENSSMEALYGDIKVWALD